MSQTITVSISDDEAGFRLDWILAEKLKGPSRSRLKILIKDGQVSCDGGTIDDPSYKVKPEETYVVHIPPPIPSEPIARDIPLDIVFEDDQLIVVNKPAGMVVHPAAGHWTKTLVNAILFHCGDSLSGVGGVLRPGIVHRLDKDTSGLIVVAKNDHTHTSLRKQFSAHTIERTYRALVWRAPRPLVGTIDVPIARGGANRKKMVVPKDPKRRQSKEAITHYSVLSKYGPDQEPTASLVECRLMTGRTHQIRVHLSHIGCPVMGDPVYGRPRQLKGSEVTGHEADAHSALSGVKRQALHAQTLGFLHPKSSKLVQFEADLPSDMKALIDKLELL